MASTFNFLLVLLATTSWVASIKIPSYMIPCSKSDPNLNACALESAKKALPNLIQGDKQLKLRPFAPFNLEKVDLSANQNLKIIFTKVSITGIENAVVNGLSIDPVKNIWELGPVNIPRLEFTLTYDINGRILILPISGHGPGNITFIEPEFLMTLQLDTEDKGGVQHYNIKESKLAYKVKRMYIQLEDLFSGDPKLGPEMNIFLNENWKEVEKEIYPVLTESFKVVLSQSLINLFAAVPADQILLP